MRYEHLKAARLRLLIVGLVAQLLWFAAPAYAEDADQAYENDRFSGSNPCGPNPDRGR